MESIRLSNLDDQYIYNANAVQKIAKQIQTMTYRIDKIGKCHDKEFEIVIGNMYRAMNFWTGGTYVGCAKKPMLRDAYQAFYTALYQFILQCRTSKDEILKGLPEQALYSGTLYRYLGHANSSKLKELVKPKYNNIWVSWSKKKENSYLEEKLYGSWTRLTCHTGTIYGIDLAVFDVVRGEEAEVVYPTFRECVDNIEYHANDIDLDEDEEDEAD